MMWNLRSYGERLSKENGILAKQPKSGWSGTDDRNKGKAGHGQGQGQARQRYGQDNNNKGKGKQHRKKRKKGFHEMEGHEDTQERQTGR